MSPKSIDFFKSMFENVPNISILNIDNNCTDIKYILDDITVSTSGSLTLKNINDIDQDKFRLTNGQFEYVVLSDCLDSIENKKEFLTKIYYSLETSGKIFILSRKGNIDVFMMKELLEEVDFTTANEIDIFDEYNLVVANKMHMWGCK